MVVLSELPEGSSSSSSAHGYNSSARDHSSSIDGYRYDVFLSFRGLDTRHNFTDHLHKALIDANIATFLDDEEIETGENLKPELESAIKASRASIVVLSKNYASSTWCLDELVLILEWRMTSNHIIIPVFYHAEPTHVRKQQSSFGDAMAKHKKTMEAQTDALKKSQWAQKMDLWSKALIEVADLKGKDVKGRKETEFIEEIVRDIHHRLHVPLRSALPLLIGRDSHIEFVTSWLKYASTHTADILTISGMGGIGKTSLAKHVYGLYCHEFQKSSYIEDITRKCDGKFNGLLDLQEQLCGDISQTSSIKVHDISVYTSKIEHAIARKRVFLVLDDISSLDQLDALLGSKGFHTGSKIIIITKDAWLTENCALFKTNIKPKHTKLLLEGLHEAESRQLLCFHAFMCNNPKAGYEVVSEKLVKYCEGHPLALEVLGKSLHNRDALYWEGCLEGLKTEIDSRINNVLKISFDSLPTNNDKKLFKYIACFFVGIDRDVTETILKACNLNTTSGIANLLDRFLLSIGWKNDLKMHGLVQEMGRFLINQESLDKPWKRSLIWCQEDTIKVLKRKKGKGNVVGLALDMRMLEKEKLGASFELKTDALSNMDSLMLLQLNYVQMDGSFKKFPEEIRWLCMHGFHLKSIPSDLPMENLVALDMSYSNIESFVGCYSNPKRLEKRQKLDGSCFKEKKLLGSLKILNLSFCEQLQSLGDFDQLPALEKLVVRNCTSLVEVCESIEHCVELVLMDLSYSKKLKKLPKNIGMLKKVKTLLLDGCNLCKSQTESTDINPLEMCITTRTSSSAVVDVIQNDMKSLTISLPRSLVSLSLARNNMSTKCFPKDFRCLSMLKELYLDRNPIRTMPDCVRTLPRIEYLSMGFCYNLRSVEHPPQTLRKLYLFSLDEANGPYVQKVVFDPEMSPLRLERDHTDSYSVPYLIEGIVKIEAMKGVEEKVLRSLGWTDLDFLNNRCVESNSSESGIQMCYEFGIFSTDYEAEEMPSGFRHRSVGSSISFTIPSSSSSPNNRIRGLNFCSLHTRKPFNENGPFQYYNDFPVTPMMTISNITKNRTWIYQRQRDKDHGDKYSDGGKYYILLSHWMFAMNEMEAGDHVAVAVTESSIREVIKECGVSVVYDEEGKKDEEEEEEDVLGYYKSWNHIIGGDLSPFQTTTGQYILSHDRFSVDGIYLQPYHRRFIPDGPDFQEQKEEYWFKAFSQRNHGMTGSSHEGKGESSMSYPSHDNA